MHSSASSSLPTIFSLILFFFFFFAASSSASSTPKTNNSNGTLTVYEVLSEYGLPSGLLPDSVRNYSLSDDGSFVVELDKPCYVQFDYLVYYDRKVSGTLKYGSITHLKGIQVKKLFLWLNVDEIRVDLPPSDSIYFQVGWINKKLALNQFQTVHSCRRNGFGFGFGSSSSSCRGSSSWSEIFKVPEPLREMQLLITE